MERHMATNLSTKKGKSPKELVSNEHNSNNIFQVCIGEDARMSSGINISNEKTHFNLANQTMQYSLVISHVEEVALVVGIHANSVASSGKVVASITRE